jgi:sterol desaturase/sphingolipid hydroxylase (fatty acid hydroxylase superfamily)
MKNVEIRRGDEPIRLFESDLLEFFTHIHPAVVVVIWLPVMVYFLVRAMQRWPAAVSSIYLPVAVLAGLFIWTFAEYVLHRFVFHFSPRKPWQERLSFLFHGVHHAQPRSKTRLVMPPAVSIPLGLLFYGLFYLVGTALGGGHWIAPLFGGFILGYLIYDLSHYAMHHLSVPGNYFKLIRRHHMRHHAVTPDQRFGVSNLLWDYVFGTEPKS